MIICNFLGRILRRGGRLYMASVEQDCSVKKYELTWYKIFKVVYACAFAVEALVWL